MRRLADALGDLADEARAYDVTETVVRRARRRRRVSAILPGAATVLVLMLLISGVLGRLSVWVLPDPDGGPRIASPLITELIESPTRGSLAGNRAFLEALRNEAAGAALGGVFGFSGDRLPGDPDDLRVLFAGDVPGNRRIATVVSAVGRPLAAHYAGRAGTPAGKLDVSSWGDLDGPILNQMWRDFGSRSEQPGPGYALLLGPAGYTVEVSERPRYLADGTIERTWTQEPAGYVLRDATTLPPGLRARFSRDGQVLYEGRVGSPGRPGPATIDPSPLFERGTAVPDAAQRTADALAFSSGLSGDGVEYVVLWSDRLEVDDPDGGGSGTGAIATVMALTADGGGPYVTIGWDTNDPPTARNHPTGEGILGDPAKALIAMRLPHWTAQTPDDLQVIAPPGATRIQVVGDGTPVAEATPDRGAARIPLPGPVDVTVRAFDASGTQLAETRFSDDISTRLGGNAAEPEIRGW